MNLIVAAAMALSLLSLPRQTLSAATTTRCVLRPSARISPTRTCTPMCAQLPPEMGEKAWEVLAVSRSKTGQYYMELCDGEACRREPIDPHQATILLANMAAGKALYANELPIEEEGA